MNDEQQYTTFVLDDTGYQTTTTPKFDRRKRYAAKDPKKLTAFIPGVIRRVDAAPGQKVSWGQRVLVLEAMKMKNDVAAPVEGVVKAVHVAVGQMVTKDQMLIEFE
jgi:biotin carboxyl carrier protein